MAGIVGAAAMGVLISAMSPAALTVAIPGLYGLAPPPFPNFAAPSLLWHLVYGAVLGAVFPAVEHL